MKTGVIDVGGGMRGVYGAGIFDYCMENSIQFDYGAGVSAGSANIVSYLAGQYHRNYSYYIEYSVRKEYMGFGNYLKTRNFINLDYIYGTLSNSGGEYPLDYEAAKNSGKEFVIVATNARTGKPHYFTMADLRQDDYGPIKCSSCVPVVNRPYPYKGRYYYDGGISDPIPYKKAFEDGCDRLVVILTRPRDFLRTTKNDKRLSLLIRHKYPESAKRLAQRASLYNNQLKGAIKLEKEGKLIIIAPESIEGLGTLKSSNTDGLIKLYDMGKKDAVKIKRFLHRQNS